MGLPGEEVFEVGAVQPLGKGCKFAAAFCPSEEHFLAQPSGFQAPKKSDFFGAGESNDSTLVVDEALWERRWVREKMRATLRRLIYAKALPMHPVRSCRVRALPSQVRGQPTGFSGNIELRHVDGEMTHRYHSIVYCRSLLICPECAAQFGYVLRETVRAAVQRLLSAGYYCFMLTLTARHTREMLLAGISQAFQEGRRWFFAHRIWKTIKQELGILGEFTALEVTDDAPDAPVEVQTGWHWHTHMLVFYRPANDFRGWFTDEYARSVERRLRKLWQKSLRRHGLDCSLEHGARLTLPRRKGIKMLTDAGAGFEGCDPASVQAAVEYISKGVLWEITGSLAATKKGRKSQRISMWEMLRRIADGDMSLVPRYAEYMQAVRGRTFLRWSQGLKPFCGLPEDEAQLLEGAELEAGDVVDFEWTDQKFRSVARYAQATAIRRVADDAAGAGKDAGEAVDRAMMYIDAGYSPFTGQRLDDIGGS